MGILSAPDLAHAELPWTTTRLSLPPLPGNQRVGAVWISPNRRIAVYAVQQQLEVGFRELRCVGLDGQADSMLLTGGLAGHHRYGDRQDWVVFSPDSRQVAFLARTPSGTSHFAELYSVPLCRPGVAPIRRSPPGEPLEGSSPVLVRFTPDSQRLVFASDQQEVEVYRVYSAPAAGTGGTIELGGARPGEISNGLVEFVPTAGSQQVVLSRRSAAGVVDLVSVPVTGPANAEHILVHGSSSAAAYPRGLTVPADGERVVYLWDDESGGEHWELYSAPLAGPPDLGVKLNPGLVTGGQVSYFAISPDGGRVAYVADQARDNVFELFSVPVGGPASSVVPLNGVLPEGSGGVLPFPDGFFFLPDSSRVIYSACVDVANRFDLYSVPAVGPGSASVRLNEGESATSLYESVFATPDSRLIAFVGDETDPASGTLHVARSNGVSTQVDLGCEDFVEAIGADEGVFAICRRGGDSFRQVQHWQVKFFPAFPPLVVRTDMTPLDDADNSAYSLEGPSAAGGVLFVHGQGVPSELFASDRRIYLGGFEPGTTAGWSVTEPGAGAAVALRHRREVSTDD